MKTDIFNSLLVFGEVPDSQAEIYDNGDYEIMISRILPILRKIFDYEEVTTLLIINTIVQLNAIYHK